MGVGRPIGYRMSEKSKKAIADSMTGKKKSEATKKKIAESVRKAKKEYYDKKLKERDENICYLYTTSGMSVQEIADTENLCRASIHRILRKAGIGGDRARLRRLGKWKDIDL